jgi:hypothetical protein
MAARISPTDVGGRLVRIETLLEETFQPKLQEIADAVRRLEEANAAPEGTPAGRELARRAEVARCAAADAHTDALKAAVQAQTALDTAKGILTTWQDIKGIVSVASRVVVVIAALLAAIVAAHTLNLIR